MNKESLSVIWWNTSLSPSKKPNRASTQQRNYCISLIEYFIHELKTDLIVLCEVSAEDIKYINENTTLLFHDVIFNHDNINKSRFDLCFIYNTLLFEADVIENITTTKASSTFKIAQKLTINRCSCATKFHILASHWPSRLHCKESDPNRILIGTRLRDAYTEIHDADEDNYTILMGDYNDEPFNDSLNNALMSSRDMQLVNRKKNLLYNPFWQYLVRQGGDKHAGTHFYKSGLTTNWFVFDQIMVSKAFTNNKKWSIVDSESKILDILKIGEFVQDKNNIFDHMPIYCKFSRNSHD